MIEVVAIEFVETVGKGDPLENSQPATSYECKFLQFHLKLVTKTLNHFEGGLPELETIGPYSTET